jgi:integrase
MMTLDSSMSSIYKRGGYWVYQTYIKDPITGYSKKVYESLDPETNKDDIPHIKNQLDAKYKKNQLKEAISPTLHLSHCKKIYIEQKEREVEQNRRSINTLRTDKNSLEIFYNFINTHYGDIDIHKISRKHIIRWKESRFLDSKVNSSSTIAVNMRTVSAFFSFLVKTERVKENPFINVDIPPTKKRKTENLNDVFESVYKFIQKEIQRREAEPSKKRKPRKNNKKNKTEWFYDNDWFVHYIWIMLNSGMRSGEISLLKWKKSKFDVGSDHSRSYTYLADDFSHIIIYFKRRLRELPVKDVLQKSFRALEQNHHGDYVFENKTTGKPISVTTVGKLFKKLLDSLELDEDHTPHSIRHGYGSYLLNNGATVYQVSRILGHSTKEITELYYTHSKHTDVADTMDIIDKMVV